MKNKKFIAMMLCLATAVSFSGCTGKTPDAGTAVEEEDNSLYDDEWDGVYTGEEILNSDQTIGTESYNFTKKNSNGLLIEGAKVSFEKLTIKKSSDRTRIKDAALTKGLGAASIVMNGRMEVSEGDIETDAAGATGIFTFTGATSDINSTNVNTKGVYSPGIAAGDGAEVVVAESTILTEGRESSGLRCADANSYMNVSNTNVETKGKNSPGVYVGNSMDLNTCEITAYASEAMRFNGVSSSWIEGCTLTGNKTGNNANDFNWNVIAYSDEKNEGGELTEVFLSTCTLTAHSGGMFYVTNTDASFYVDNCEIVNSESDDDFFLRCQGNNDLWGRMGSNGAKCNFILGGTKVSGGVYYDSISELGMYVTNGSEFTGFVKKDEKFAGDGGNGFCTIGVQDGCKWIVTKDSELENLQCSGGEIVDEEGKAVTVKGTDGTVYMEGESGITVTVNTFSESMDY